MQTKVSYEWSIETIDENEDIIDSSFWDEKPHKELEENERLVLVRNEGNEIEGITDRLWAYVIDGKLPKYFSDSNDCVVSIKVPKRFIQ
jgi:hypothetical protein